MATTPYPIPPSFQIAKVGKDTLQATDAMAAWMRSLTTQASAALDKVPAGTVTHQDTNLPENSIVLGNGSDTVTTVPDPVTPDLVLVSSGAGQRPRWVHLSAITPSGVQLVMEPPPPPLPPAQQRIVDQILALLHELIQVSRTS